MKFAELGWRLFLALAVFTAAPSRAADVVYDNSVEFSGSDYEHVDEYGDEVILAGTARAVTEIQIEYYAEFIPQGDELGRVRFYSNTGPTWGTNQDYHLPAEPPLFEQTFQLAQGYQTAIISVPNVVVPDSFTWTVQFLGISQNGTTDRAGLLFYGSATVGASYDDFWQRSPTAGWGPVQVMQAPNKNNFGARILAVAAAPQLRLTITKVGNNLLITWPSGDASFKLEAKSDLNATTWTQVSPAPTLNGARYEVVVPIGSGNQFFRLRSP
jgi:hypothetical protein